MAEVVLARIYGGLHFRHSMEDGQTLARRIARLVTTTEFRPT